MAEFESLVAAAASLRLLSILSLLPTAFFLLDAVNVTAHHLIDFAGSRPVYLLPLILSRFPFFFLVLSFMWHQRVGCFLEFALLVETSLLFLGELDLPGAGPAILFEHRLGQAMRGGVFGAELLHGLSVFIESDHIFRLNFRNDIFIVIFTFFGVFSDYRVSIFRLAFAKNALNEGKLGALGRWFVGTFAIDATHFYVEPSQLVESRLPVS